MQDTLQAQEPSRMDSQFGKTGSAGTEALKSDRCPVRARYCPCLKQRSHCPMDQMRATVQSPDMSITYGPSLHGPGALKLFRGSTRLSCGAIEILQSLQQASVVLAGTSKWRSLDIPKKRPPRPVRGTPALCMPHLGRKPSPSIQRCLLTPAIGCPRKERPQDQLQSMIDPTAPRTGSMQGRQKQASVRATGTSPLGGQDQDWMHLKISQQGLGLAASLRALRCS